VARSLARVRRYEAACQRRLDRSLKLLLSGRLTPVVAPQPSTESRPVATSAPDTPVAPVSASPPASPGRPVKPPVCVNPPEVDPRPAPAGVVSDPPADHPRGNRRWRKAQMRRERERAA
jgi:hypothetical protein